MKIAIWNRARSVGQPKMHYLLQSVLRPLWSVKRRWREGHRCYTPEAHETEVVVFDTEELGPEYMKAAVEIYKRGGARGDRWCDRVATELELALDETRLHGTASMWTKEMVKLGEPQQ